MDDLSLKKAFQALKWEANYRKKYNLEKSGDIHFLAPQENLDADFEKHLGILNITKGDILDIGTGTGEQATFLAKKGFKVTAIDVS